jgi:phosphoglucosamine mutase
VKYFGTDGVRGIFGREITPGFCRAVARVIIEQTDTVSRGASVTVAVGYDTRAGGAFIADIISAELRSAGISVENFGVVTTAELSFLTASAGAHHGIMITASHNSYKFNGIKIFNTRGEKLNRTEMQEFDDRLTKQMQRGEPPPAAYPPPAERPPRHGGRWCEHLAEKFSSLRGWSDPPHIIVDAAFGAGAKNAKAVFERLGLPAEIINGSPDGFNINKGCGAVFPEMLLRAVKKHKGNCIGFAFDGDADRCIAVTRRGVIHGDRLIAMLASGGTDPGGCGAEPSLDGSRRIVVTEVFNPGAEKYLRGLGVSVIKTAVGDRFVFEAMSENNIEFGGETSGHIIACRVWHSGDGLAAALMLLSRVRQSPGILETKIKIMPSLTKNIAISPADSLKFENTDFGAGVIVRPSGTEDVLRITVTGRTGFCCKIKMKRVIVFAKSLIKH